MNHSISIKPVIPCDWDKLGIRPDPDKLSIQALREVSADGEVRGRRSLVDDGGKVA
jgi:hypothetical protein